MSRIRASLIFDPNRREEQMAFVRERVSDLHEYGAQVWTSVTEDQAARFAERGIFVQLHEGSDLIQLPAVVFDPSQAVPEPPADLAALEPSGEETAYYLVQFIAPPDPNWISFIEELGASLVQDVPAQTRVFRMTATQAAQAREEAYVTWVGLYHPAYALHYYLAGRDEPFTAADLRTLRVDPARVVATDTGTLEASFFFDRTTAEMGPALEAIGATVRTDTGHSLVIDVSAQKVADLLRIPGVCAVETYAGGSLSNQRAGRILGANQVRNFGFVDFLINLDGGGEIVGVLDSGLDTGGTPAGAPAPGMHLDFVARVLSVTNVNNAAFPTIDVNLHGTHVVGSIIGDGAQAGGFPPPPAPPNPTNPRGIAPRASLIFHSLNTAAPPALNFANFMKAFQAAYAGGARVHSNSWQTINPAVNPYSQRSGIIDRFIFLRPDLLLLFASMNAEADLNNNGILDMNSITEQGATKNALCIGACENETSQDGRNQNYRTIFPGRYTNAAFNATAGAVAAFSTSDNANDLALFSNRGRVTASKRIKPDLVAPGTNIISTGPGAMLPFAAGDARRPNTAPANFYYLDSGTSMATPLAAGAAILVRQFYRTRFSQLRRPMLIEALPPAPPPPAFVDSPSAAAHRDGCVLAWVRPTAAGPNHAVAARFDRRLRQIGAIIQLRADIGAHPAITVARHGDNTLLAHRGSDNKIRLSLYDPLLAPIAAFGTAGVATLAKASRAEDDRRPTLCVRDNEAAVAWIQAGTSDLLFQRFRADTGAAIDANEKLLGLCDNTSTHPYLAHNGDRYAAVWARLDGVNYKLLLRFIDNAGNPQAVTPITLVTQAQPIREAHPVWDARWNHYLIVWVGEDAGGRRISALRVRPDGTVIGASQDLVKVTAAQVAQRPRVAPHPVSGYVLLWEDNTQGTHDLYMTFLNDAGNPDGRIIGNRLQISDTPNDIGGFSMLVDNDGALPVWQSDDEINSELRGLYALNVTSGGAFQAQADANTPLLQSGHYVTHQLIEHDALDLSAIALAWGGGDFYHLRAVQGGGLTAELHLVRTTADGKPDTAFGPLGVRRIDNWTGYDFHCLLWTGARLVAACSTGGTDSQVFLLDAAGASIAGFGGTGKVRLSEVPANTISIQVGQRGAGANSRIFVAYSQRRDPGPHRIRYTVMTETGATAGADTVAPRDLVSQADGTATQGWFHVVSTDAPVHLIAAWHVTVGANLVVRLNRFQLNGNPQAGVAGPIVLTALAGDSQNAVIAPRPILFAPPFPVPPAAVTNSRRREYGVAWQYRPDAAAPWEIRFSRLNRDATAHPATRDVQVFADAANHGTEPQMVWHTDGYGLAWLKQPVAGGGRQLFFTVLDENGARVNLAVVIPGAPPPPPMPAPDFPLSSASADVQSFHLVWSGRAFRIAWTEIEGGKIRHQQMAIAVPRLQGESRYDEPFRQPSSALVRATLINGATNIRNTALPNFGADPNDGYGWGRINLRQSLAPAPPVTFHVRDDSAVAAGQTARYEFYLPPNTMLLRITLAWTDPPGNNLVNNLNLRVTSPASGATPSRVYVGNRWQAGPLTPNSGPPFSDPLPAVPPVNPFENIHNVEQVVLPAPPSGLYVVEVIGGRIPDNAFTQFPGQTFALVFVGSGPELRTALVRPAAPPAGPLPFY